MRLFCLGAVVLVVGCGAVRTDPRSQQQLDINSANNGYGEEQQATGKAAVAYKPMKFDMSGGSSGAMYTSGASPGSAGGALVASAGHPYSYEEAAPASTYVIPTYTNEHHFGGHGHGGGYIGLPHKTTFLPGHKYRPHEVKFDLHK